MSSCRADATFSSSPSSLFFFVIPCTVEVPKRILCMRLIISQSSILGPFSIVSHFLNRQMINDLKRTSNSLFRYNLNRKKKKKEFTKLSSNRTNTNEWANDYWVILGSDDLKKKRANIIPIILNCNHSSPEHHHHLCRHHVLEANDHQHLIVTR